MFIVFGVEMFKKSNYEVKTTNIMGEIFLALKRPTIILLSFSYKFVWVFTAVLAMMNNFTITLGQTTIIFDMFRVLLFSYSIIPYTFFICILNKNPGGDSLS